MVTLNINIEGYRKGIQNPAQVSTNTGAPQDAPSPVGLLSAEGVESNAPIPTLSDTTDAGLSAESVPHPELSGLSASSVLEQSPSPEDSGASLSSEGSGVPVPSDTESKTTATPTKRKSRTTKTKTSGK